MRLWENYYTTFPLRFILWFVLIIIHLQEHILSYTFFPTVASKIAILFQVVYQNHVNDVIKMLINHWEVIFSLDEPAGPLYERIVADTV